MIQITDLKLPVKSTKKILEVLESNNMPARVPDRERGLFNCWGFTAWYMQWEPCAIWLRGSTMERHLRKNTVPISREEVQAGDIAVFYEGDYFSHTAIILPGGDVICHKPGCNELCIDTVENASKTYGDVSYARPVKKSEKEFDNS